MAKAVVTAMVLSVFGSAFLPALCADDAVHSSGARSAAPALQIAAKPAARTRQGIFAYTNRQQTSQVLGATGVAAYVASASGSRQGFYIMSVTNSGLWRRMSLQPGDLLISVDNQVITGGDQADSVLDNMTPGTRDVLFCRLDDDGQPQFIRSQASISPADQARIASADRMHPTSRQGAQHESIASLEAYSVELVNADRSRIGKLPPVRTDPTLSKLARDYAQYLVEHRIFAHVDDQGRDPMVRAKQHGVKAGVFENLAFQQYGWGSERDMISAAQRSMINEPEGQMNHRSNILGAERQYVGVGVYTDGHELMLVQEFTNTEP